MKIISKIKTITKFFYVNYHCRLGRDEEIVIVENIHWEVRRGVNEGISTIFSHQNNELMEKNRKYE